MADEHEGWQETVFIEYAVRCASGSTGAHYVEHATTVSYAVAKLEKVNADPVYRCGPHTLAQRTIVRQRSPWGEFTGDVRLENRETFRRAVYSRVDCTYCRVPKDHPCLDMRRGKEGRHVSWPHNERILASGLEFENQ